MRGADGDGLLHRHRNRDGFHVRRESALRAAHESVLTDRCRREELLARGAAHRAGHRRDDHVRQAQSVEGGDVGVAVPAIGVFEAGIVDVERVRVLHHELAAAQNPRARAGFIAVLGLNLVDHQRKVLIGGVLPLDHLGEQFLVRGPEQVVRSATVLQAEQVVPVLGPPARRLVRLLGNQGGEMHFLKAGVVHFLPDDPLDIAERAIPQRQPGEHPGGDTSDVSGPHQQSVAGHFSVGRVIAQRAEQQRRHTQDHVRVLPEDFARG